MNCDFKEFMNKPENVLTTKEKEIKTINDIWSSVSDFFQGKTNVLQIVNKYYSKIMPFINKYSEFYKKLSEDSQMSDLAVTGFEFPYTFLEIFGLLPEAPYTPEMKKSHSEADDDTSDDDDVENADNLRELRNGGRTLPAIPPPPLPAFWHLPLLLLLQFHFQQL